MAVHGWVTGTTAVLLAGVVLGALLASVALLTVGRSLQRARRQRRREAIREALRPALLERLYGPDDPGWGEWVDTLSSRERSVLESLLEEYLRELEGSDARSLAGLGAALGIGERARRHLEDGDRYERLDALTWLALLEDPPERLEDSPLETSRERAAAARVLYRGEGADAAEGVALLLHDPAGPFSVFGIDTLYRLVERDPGPLFERAARDAGEWSPALREQVLLVARHVPTVAGGADLSWVVDALSAPEERTRVEAARALGGYGWRRDLRESVDLDALRADPSPAVRGAVYRMLGEWGDADAVDALRSAAADETDDRARVVAAAALVGHVEPGAEPEGLGDAWTWAAEHAAFDRRATDVSGYG